MTNGQATQLDLDTFPGDHHGNITIIDLQTTSCRIATDHGFWQLYDDINSYNAAASEMGDSYDERMIPVILDSKLMLITGEVAEAEDALRHRRPMPAFAEELADIMIRTADLAHKLGINLEAAIAAKQAYNEQRPHLHGKQF